MFSYVLLHVYVAFALVAGKLLCRLMCFSGSTPCHFGKTVDVEPSLAAWDSFLRGVGHVPDA